MFGRRKTDAPDATPTEDPMLSAKLASTAVFDGLVKPLKLTHGLPSQVIAAALGGLAGHACQGATLKGLASGDAAYAGLSIVEVGGKNGDQYLMGDAINRPVLEWQYSVWALVAGITEHMGFPIPDVHDIARHVSSTVGGEAFGVPRDLPAGAPTPRRMLSLWTLAESLTKNVAHPDYVPVAFALAYQRLAQTDNVADPSIDQGALARIMVESAVAMSKLRATTADLAPR